MKTRIHLTLTALILIVMGVICMLNPSRAFSDIAWIIGLLIIASGIVTLLFGMSARALLPNATNTKMMAIFQLVTGGVFMLNAWIDEPALVVVFAMWMLFESVSIIIGAFDYKRVDYQQWWLIIIFGLVSIVLSIYAICNPAKSALSITALLGIGLLSLGIVRMTAIPAISRLQRTLKNIEKNNSSEGASQDNQ